jgi:hypothetical protein
MNARDRLEELFERQDLNRLRVDGSELEMVVQMIRPVALVLAEEIDNLWEWVPPPE